MPQPNGPYYVIVGVGFSAVLNHSLLKATDFGKERLADLEIRHIGMADPWGDYLIERMGQWPGLLTLPGFENQHATEEAADFLRCRAFAEATAQQLKRLTSENRIVRARVTDVQVANGIFTVHYHAGGQPKELPASKIDFCTGWGPAHTLNKCIVDQCYHAEYPDATTLPQPRRLMTAIDFLCNKEPMPNGSTVCIYGDGGTAAWCVENALASDTREVVWVSCGAFRTSTIPKSGRNNGLFAEFDNSSTDEEPLSKFRPLDQRLKMWWGYKIVKVGRDGSAVRLHFDLSGLTEPGCLNSQGLPLGGLDCRAFDQVVVAIGQRYDGRLLEILESIRYPILSDGGRDADKVIVGGADHDDPRQSKLRLLGPLLSSRQFRKQFAAGKYLSNWKRLDKYVGTLPGQADGGLITAHGALIAKANGYFDEQSPNRNIHTASAWDLANLGVDDNVARGFISKRNSHAEPFTAIPGGLKELSLVYEPRRPA
jgi:hypothetical protein